jgi:hypothetical protein
VNQALAGFDVLILASIQGTDGLYCRTQNPGFDARRNLHSLLGEFLSLDEAPCGRES